MSLKPSPGGKQGLQRQKDNTVVPMGKWSWATEI